jgi:RNA ligase (TIGR02306 family)
MGEGRVEVIRVGEVVKHPNADSLSITKVHGGYPCCFRTGDFVEGDLAVYIPVDSIVPEGERFAFLGEHRRIRAKRLRGVFSMGLLTKGEPGWVAGQDVASELGIVRYTPPDDEAVGASDEPDPGLLPVYDVEGLRRWPDVLVEDEIVQITEKLHGESARFVHDGERLWVGSRTRFKKDLPAVKWWQAAHAYGLTAKLAEAPHVVFYGETHGYTGGFSYGQSGGSVGLRFFDAIDVKSRTWLDVGDFHALCRRLGLPTVPVLYTGPWTREISRLAEGNSTLDAGHVREGFVVRPMKERYDAMGPGRVILKLHGEGFLARTK